MNNTIDDFFNEINELEPPQQSKQKQTVWRECYDELTGYSYYWNVKTDEVTWNTPSDFKSVKDQKKDKSLAKKDLYIPPRAAPLLPSSSSKVPETSIKIYSIGQSSEKKSFFSKNRKVEKTEKNNSVKKVYRRDSDSADEKIELITSYGDDSDSEIEESDHLRPKDQNNKNEAKSDITDDDADILTKIQIRTKELKEMGGDLPPQVAKVINTEKVVDTPPSSEKNVTSSISLIAGYSDSEDEQDNEEMKSIFATIPEPPKVAHSTLFPITKRIEVKDFLETSPLPDTKVETPTNEFDSKAFQRKKRIGIALVNTGKRKEEIVNNDTETRGLGFKMDEPSNNTKDNIYPGFRKGGVMFVKSDVLNPSLSKGEENDSDHVESKTEEFCSVKWSELEEIYSTLMEKLGFLSEGRPQVSPVQVMIIQAETLFTAMKANGLKPLYLQRWLNDTHTDLMKLEKQAAPEGWLLQWDRSHKRYYYQNQTTGESQWEYPQPDISRCDEAMDISTTPPPADPMIHLSPPLPPCIRSPTPPPPPIISQDNETATKVRVPEVPLPPEPVPPAKFLNEGEPLPPGVDLPEIIAYTEPKEKEVKAAADPLCSALDSFYSDIASIENPNSSSPPLPPPVYEENKTEFELSEPPKKKRKSKVKLAPGLAMKKKGVSQLVEKWKNVQQHYND